MSYPLRATQACTLSSNCSWLLLLALIFSIPAPILAQGSEQLHTLLAEVVAQHPQIEAGRQDVEAAVEEAGAARWERFPTLGISGQVDERDESTLLRVEQPLWTGGRISGQIALSDSRSDMAGAELQQARLDILERTATAWFDMLRLEQQLQTAVANVEEHQRLQESIARRVASEVSPAADESLAFSRHNQARTEQLMLQQRLRTARNELEQLVGRPLGSLADVPAITLPQRTLEEWQGLALAAAPARQLAEAELAVASSEEQLARARKRPTIVAGYAQRLQGYDSFNDPLNAQPQDLAYISFRYEPGAGLSSLALSRAANARRGSALSRIGSIERDVRQEVADLWAEIELLSLQEPQARDTADAIDAVVDSYLRQFQVGSKSWLDVLNVQREKSQSRYALADIHYPLQLARLRLLLRSGEEALLLELLHE